MKTMHNIYRIIKAVVGIIFILFLTGALFVILRIAGGKDEKKMRGLSNRNFRHI